MGGTASVFKTFCQRLIRRRKRDRWVREEKKKLLPDASKSKRGPTKAIPIDNHQVLPKRIDEQVFDKILQEQGIPRRRVEEPTEEPGFHEDIHRRQLALLQYGYIPSSSPVAESYESTASFVREGTEKVGANFYTMDDANEKKDWKDDEEEKLRADYDRVQWVRIDWDNVENDSTLERIDEAAGEQGNDEEETTARWDDEETTTTTLDEDDSAEGTMEDYEDERTDDGDVGTMDENDDDDSLDFDEDNQMPDEEDNKEEGWNYDEEQTESDVLNEGAYALERFEVQIHTCSSGEAFWCDDI